MVQMVDHSEVGWSVVAKYNAEELGDDSENEKRLEKADNFAGREVVK